MGRREHLPEGQTLSEVFSLTGGGPFGIMRVIIPSEGEEYMKKKLIKAIADMNEQEALQLAQSMLENGEDPQVILDAGSEAMSRIGDRYDAEEYYLPELILAGDMMRQLGEIVKPKLRPDAAQSKTLGTVVIGTVAGDIHDIGKDVVAFMLEVNNFQVHDLGVDVNESSFVDKIREAKPDVVGMSGFLTLGYEQMKKTVDAIKQAGMRDQVKIMIGGSIMNEESAEYAGADAYGADANAAVKLAKSWKGGK
jgi:5-methyltetrahydrofolate--homocysteine methyltransferase